MQAAPQFGPGSTPITDTLVHGMTFGLDEHVAAPAAAYISSLLTGTSYTDNLNRILGRLHAGEEKFAEEHPYQSFGTEVTGAIASPISRLAGPLHQAIAAGKNAGILQRIASLAGHAMLGGGEGALASASMSHAPWGGEQWRSDVRQGTYLGAGLPLVAPIIRGLRNTWRSARPDSQVDRITGEQLDKMASTTPPPAGTPQGSPGNIPRGGMPGPAPPWPWQAKGPPAPGGEQPQLPGMRFDSGSALNDPAIAAEVRRFHETPRGAAPGADLISDQGAAVRQGYAAAGSTGMDRPTASSIIVRAVRNAWDALRTEENRLWNVPALRNLRPNLVDLHHRIGRALDALPYRDRAAIMGNGPLMNAIRDLAQMGPADATLANINAVRSDILKIARSMDDPAAARAANAAADAILRSFEANPALRNNPAASDAYRRARAFTAMKWDTFGHKGFLDMVDTNPQGHYTANEATAAEKLFNFSRGRASETVPGQMRRVIDTMDRMQRWWTTLQRAGQQAGDPRVARQAMEDLIDGSRDFIIRNMMDAAESSTLDRTANHRVIWHSLSRWIETNRDWIRRSGLFARSQLDALDDLHHDAIWAAKLTDLRAGTGSQTYQHLMQDANVIQLFASPMFIRGIGLLGGLPGAFLGRFNDAGIGLILGLGAENVGRKILTAMYTVPIEKMRAKVEEALHNPALLQDLRRPIRQMPTEQAIAWVRSILSAAVPGAAASLDTQGQQK